MNDKNSSNSPFATRSKHHANGVNSFINMMRQPIVCYYTFIFVVVILTVFGLLMVFSSSSVELVSEGKSPFLQLISQTLFAVFGCCIAWIEVKIPIKTYQHLSFIILLISMVLQALTLVIGVSSGGNTGWIKIGSFTFQPAEIMKLALCLWMPQAISVGQKTKRTALQTYGVAIIGFVLCFALIMIGKDLGTDLIILLIGAVAIYSSGFNLKVFAGTAAAVVVMIMGVFVVGSSNRMDRVAALFSGCASTQDIQGICYQSIHGQYALATGGLTGLGLGASREKWNYLPEAYNDFIFAIIGEELGFIGTLLVLVCFAILAWCLINIALHMKKQPYPRVVLVCIATWILGQALINIMVVLQILPVIGLPLPFVSAGGTALVMCLAAAGVAVRMAREQPDIKAVLRK